MKWLMLQQPKLKPYKVQGCFPPKNSENVTQPILEKWDLCLREIHKDYTDLVLFHAKLLEGTWVRQSYVKF